jgi:predicted RNase H-like HicB family nuclease
MKARLKRVSEKVDYYMSLSYRIEVIEDKEEGGYVLRCPELRGCITYVSSLEQGLEMLEDAKRAWFSACLEDQIPIPMPSHLDNYSGQFKLRMPKSLHKELAERSRLEGISMNQYCLHLLSGGLKVNGNDVICRL